MILIDDIYKILLKNELTISFCESVTGGMISSYFVNVDGISKVYQGGTVVYSNFAKEKFAKVNPDTIKKHGAISVPTIKELALNTNRLFNSDICLAISGNAGPHISEDKPIGYAILGICVIDQTYIFELSSDKQERNEIRIDLTIKAFTNLYKVLKEIEKC